jgi:hypothetical protein
MADNEEVFKLLIQAEGQEILPKLQAQLAATNEAFGGLAAAFGRGEVDEKAFGEQSKVLADQHRNLAKAIKDVEDASGKGSSKLAGFGQTALQSGRIVQDFAQGGVGGILNNIEGLTMALGMGSGLAGILTIVGVAFMTLKPQIAAFWEALSGGNSKEILSAFETLSVRVKELKDQPLKLAVDRHELEAAEEQLDRLKRGHAEYEAQQKRQTVAESSSGKAIDDVLGEAGAPELEAAMKARMIDAQQRQSGPLAEARRKQIEADAEIQAAKDAKRDATTPEDLIGASGALDLAQRKRDAAAEEEKQITAAIGKNAKGSIGGIIEGAKNDHGAGQAARQGQLADQLRGIGRDDLARQVERNNPQKFRDIEALNAQGAQNEAAMKIAADAEKAREKAEARPDGPIKVRNLGAAGPAALGPGQAPKGKIDSDADRRAALIQRRANQIQDQSQFYTGQQFSPEQAQHAAAESVRLQARGLNAQQATVQAMGELLATMAGFGAKLQGIEQKIEGVRGNNRQLNRRANQQQPSGLNSGGRSDGRRPHRQRHDRRPRHHPHVTLGVLRPYAKDGDASLSFSRIIGSPAFGPDSGTARPSPCRSPARSCSRATRARTSPTSTRTSVGSGSGIAPA